MAKCAGQGNGTMPVWPYHMNDYQHFRAAIQSKTLRWSYGAIKGRADATWQQATAALPAPAMISALRAKGFSAIWVQFNGYQDGGAAIRRELNRQIGPPMVVKADGLFAVWRL